MASVAGSQEQPPAAHGHSFCKKTFHKPTYCHHCSDMLWGLIQQGFICEVCNFVVHDRCLRTVVSPCSSVSASQIRNPVAHCWSESFHHKRKFCNVCRKRLDDSESIHCEICEYFVHVECQDFAVADCKENATYLPGKQLTFVRHQHHWREGNLPSNSKCALCKKTCWTTECLSGYRCEWCGMTSHASCHTSINSECTFGILEPIYLPPHAVSIPRTEVPMEAIIGVQVRRKDTLSLISSDTVRRSASLTSVLKRLSVVLPNSCQTKCQPNMSPPYVRARSTSEEFSSGDAGRYRDSEDYAQTHAPTRDSRQDKQNKNQEERDEEAIKVYDGNNSLRRRIFRIIVVPRQAPLRQVLTQALRAFHITKDPNSFHLTDLYSPDEAVLQDPTPVLNLHRKEGKRPAVFLRFRDRDNDAGEVRVYPGKLQVSQAYCTVPVDSNTNVGDLISDALNRFGLEDSHAEDYRCSEVLLDRGVTERVLSWNERPWEIMKQLGKDSIRQMELMRFYLQLKQDPHGPNLALFVGNLPPNLSERNYENILTDFLGKENKFSKIGPIYYEYGSMVITYEDSDKAVRALYALRESKYEDKQPLLVMLLPNIEPSMIPQGVQPLLVFVNVKSGGCQGLELISSFRKLLNPYQVFDLDNGGPLPGLYVFRNIQNYKILVCGGDGTIGWVLQCLDNVGQDSQCSSPACAIVPLGTGNDLARVLRWGPGYTGGEDPLNLLRDVIDAEEIRLDRWTVVFHPEDKPDDNVKQCNSTGKRRKKLSKIKVTNEQIRKSVSWGSGANPWGPEKDDQFSKPNHWDGMLEVVGVTGVVHLGQIQSGLRSAMRIAQGGHIKIHLNSDIPVQVDGEPWVQSPCDVVVLKSALKATMLKKMKGKMKRRNTEPTMLVSPGVQLAPLPSNDGESPTDPNTNF
uniref:Diacylglycerol kinase n=1 Tax=Diabrotica virgifera virgifera TaxID=50390 RepID=A0A6P7G6K9_DIAVI